MESTVLNWLASVGSTAFRWSAIAFFLVNGVAVAAVILTRDRSLVNRWTARILAANLVIVGTGLGVPLITTASRLAISIVMPDRTSIVPEIRTENDPQPVTNVRPDEN